MEGIQGRWWGAHGAENIGRGWENYDVEVTGKDWMEE